MWRRCHASAAALVMAAAFAGAATPATAGFQLPCIGDCGDLALVDVTDLVLGVGLVLGTADIDACPAFDRDSGGVVTVDELLEGVRNALLGCPQVGCGDEVITGTEQCDDGNQAAGDGCDASCVAEPAGSPDQAFLADCRGEFGTFGISYAIPVGQEFTPSAEQVVGVAVLVSSSMPFDGAPEPLIARIRGESIASPVLGEAIVRFGPSAQGFRTFVFDPPVSTVPGEVYVLELWTPGTRLSWHQASNQSECAYLNGRPVLFGDAQSGGFDFGFITYVPN